MDLSLFFACALSALALMVSLSRATQRIQDAKGRADRFDAMKTAQSERIRKEARTTLGLKRELRAIRRRKEILEEECRLLETRLKRAAEVDHVLYVLDDRRTPADQGWVAVIANPEVLEHGNPHLNASAVASWKIGRRFIVWALDEKKAREKIAARYPDRLGFALTSISPHRKR